jgi:RNA polymerase-binding transcription factor DksA
MLDIEDAVHFSDESDRASHIEEAANVVAIEAVRALVAPESDPDFDGKTCIECGEAIPRKRLDLGKIRCVSCQGVKEIKSRLYAK